MLSVLAVVLPVFLIVGAGYGAARFAGYGQEAVDGLMGFTVRFAVPVLLFGAMYRLDLAQAFDPGLLLSFYIGAGFCFVAAIYLSRRIWGRRPGEAVSIGFCAMFSNTVLLGLPVMASAYGDASLPPAFAIIALHAPLGYLVGITVMEFARRDGAGFAATVRRAAAAMFSNSLTIGIAAGLAMNFAGIALPGFVLKAVDMMSAAALPAALFGLGGALTRYRLKADLGEAAMATGLSVIVHPAIAYVLAALVFGLPPDMVRAAVVIAAMPTGMNGYVFAAMYQRAEGASASTVLLGTGLSVFTIAFWLWALERWPG